MFKPGYRIGLLALLLGYSNAMAAVLDDPTRPPGYRLILPHGQQSRAPSWYVNAIRISAKQRMAIVNGRRVKVGDRVDGAVVIEILPTKVRLRHNKQDVSIKLIAGNIKKQTHKTGQ